MCLSVVPAPPPRQLPSKLARRGACLATTGIFVRTFTELAASFIIAVVSEGLHVPSGVLPSPSEES